MSIWTQRVKDLSACGMTYAQIASEIHLAPSTVGDLANGRYKTPGYEAAVALKALHDRVMAERAADAPMREAG
ncbi:helix-turn-helix domain-containing protein [Dyella ginsengisoli]|uniref:Helix-turn-helix domain-containing protein n=1 Tax=Dyella ginsengisoli TaxID=363848 RepID=A0ABW8JTT1_9GAMM